MSINITNIIIYYMSNNYQLFDNTLVKGFCNKITELLLKKKITFKIVVIDDYMSLLTTTIEL